MSDSGGGAKWFAHERFSAACVLRGAYYAAAMESRSVHNSNLHSPPRWGLPAEAVAELGERLHRFWLRFRQCFSTRTRDPSPLAHDYLRALLTIERGRNFANIERRLNGGDGQRLQHFMSYSPWSGPAVLRQIRREIVETPELGEGGTLILDECADEKAGGDSAGAPAPV